jgi:acetyl-CoA carboxylase biotin carboxylase subunit
MKRSFEKIAIVTHGEAAGRLIRAIRELNYEQHLSLAAVVLFTEPDRQAIFVCEADDAVCIGPQQYRVTMSGKA